MWKKALAMGLLVAAVAGLSAPLWSQDKPAATQPATTPPAGGEAKKYDFDSNEALAGWTITGDVTIDTTKGREGKGGALKIAAGGKVVLKLRDKDESGKVEMWLYDDGTKPDDPKANRQGPRWAITQSDGKLLAVGVLYAKYLGGDTGYTAVAGDGKKWYSNLQWLGGKRTPAGWHKWTFDFDADKGLRLLVDDKEMLNQGKPRLDWNKTEMKGFSGICIWGDGGKGNEQTLWVDDVSVTLGGPMKAVPVAPPPASPAPATKPAETK